MLTRTLLFAVAAIFALTTPAAPTAAAELSSEESDFFETKIRPVLVKECFGCHSNQSGNARGGLRLDTKELTRIGGSSGPAIAPGDLDESLLWNAINHQDFVMPPKRKLSSDVIADFRRWIEMGAPDPRETQVVEIKSTITNDDVREAKENFWAYKPPVRLDPPSVENTAWPKTDIDRFVLAQLEASGLTVADDAEPYKVLRRLCFDLVGLPPRPDQVESFVADWKRDPDQAIAAVVDGLLESDQFGQRWGRHWLDVARYAESTGREVNMTYPHAWRYRDYVIDSFNQDKPFDQFVQEQIAGDLLPAKTDQQWSQNLIATTFLAMGPKNVNEQNATQFAADLVDEQIDATTRVFLGTSVACARCHDHKFDAIPQADYYAMAGIFRSMKTYFGNPPSEYGTFATAQTRRTSSLLLLPTADPDPVGKQYSATELTRLRDEISAKISEQDEARRGGRNENSIQMRLRLSNELAELSAKIAVVDGDGKPKSFCMGVQESDSPQNARVLVRGEIDQPGPIVARGFPQVLCSQSASIDAQSSGRLELARWIGSDQNPLTARVMVNRIWQHLIGQGIVTSTENFGVTGTAPSHGELLDNLSVEFVESGWSVKSIIRKIATSRVYRISSEFHPEHFEYDPDNALLWRANAKRLDAEALRDAMLSVSGEIELDQPLASEVGKAGYVRVRGGILGDPREMLREMTENMMRSGAQEAFRQRFAQSRRGPAAGMRPPLGGDRNMLQQQSMQAMSQVSRRIQNALDMEDAKFRSVYLPIVRDELPRSLEVFDFADANSIVGTRESSNTANQALYLLNNRFVIQQSEALAKRILKDHSRPADQLEAAFLLTYGRSPTSGERSATAAFVRSFSSITANRSNNPETFAALCQSLFASSEFRYID